MMYIVSFKQAGRATSSAIYGGEKKADLKMSSNFLLRLLLFLFDIKAKQERLVVDGETFGNSERNKVLGIGQTVINCRMPH
jgi:hypothetical protein